MTCVPVVILGGKKVARVADVLAMAEESVRAGGRGVVFGRNVWQHDNPAGIVAALRRVVHEGMSAAEALDGEAAGAEGAGAEGAGPWR